VEDSNVHGKFSEYGKSTASRKNEHAGAVSATSASHDATSATNVKRNGLAVEGCSSKPKAVQATSNQLESAELIQEATGMDYDVSLEGPLLLEKTCTLVE
jgi:hypothetical protein